MQSYGYKKGQYRSSSRRTVGYERALEHIRQAEVLSRELGGTDQDVKNYFFSLSFFQLKVIFDQYEIDYGKAAREYAEKTLSSWKSGRVHMSGMVAERLFNLLPPTMPLEVKFQLTESLWKHVGPSTNKKYYVGRDVDIDEIARLVKEYLERVVTQYQIPSEMEIRFNWLSQGDVSVKQQLLNHFRQLEKELLSDVLKSQLPILLNHINSEKGNLTNHMAQVLKVGKHEVQIIINDKISGISELEPRQSFGSGGYGWIWLVAGFLFVLWLLNK